MCIYICMCIYIYIYIYVCVHTNAHLYIYICIRERERERKSYVGECYENVLVLPFVTLNNLVNWATFKQGSPSM